MVDWYKIHKKTRNACVWRKKSSNVNKHLMYTQRESAARECECESVYYMWFERK